MAAGLTDDKLRNGIPRPAHKKAGHVTARLCLNPVTGTIIHEC